MRRTIILAAILPCMSIAGAARADQFSYVSLPQAVAALRALEPGATVQEWCAPCGDAVARPLTVRAAGIDRVWDGDSARAYRDGDGTGYWQVVVDGRDVDLAYLYVRSGEGWENLALKLGLDAVEVPRTLPPERVGR